MANITDESVKMYTIKKIVYKLKFLFKHPKISYFKNNHYKIIY